MQYQTSRDVPVACMHRLLHTFVSMVADLASLSDCRDIDLHSKSPESETTTVPVAFRVSREVVISAGGVVGGGKAGVP